MADSNESSTGSTGILDSLKMSILLNMKTGDPMYDMILSFMLTSVIAVLFTQFQNIFEIFNYRKIGNYIKTSFSTKITIEGKRTFRNSHWSAKYNNVWSKRFDAIWDHINNHSGYEGISCLKEMMGSGNYGDDCIESTNNAKKKLAGDIYVVDQGYVSFPLDNMKTIYATVNFSNNNTDSEKMIEMVGKLETITIEIYSFSKSIKELKEYVDELTLAYMKKIEDKRHNKIFIYTLQNMKTEDDGGKYQWIERPFKSNRTFDNLYFDGKRELIDKIDFFVNNKDWYEKEGHPYTLGIGLSGLPGTGKTSIIKSIANKLGRHLIQIPLNKIKCEDDFYKYYFESTYNHHNDTNTVDFDKKIIVLEDLDCMSDLVLDRSKKNIEPIDTLAIDGLANSNDMMLETIVNAVKVANNNDPDKTSGQTSKPPTCKNLFVKENKLTLSFILNILDGLDENYGRILIITSNFYENIDKALVRPGRIDLRVEMKNASIQTIKDMYLHYYGTKIPRQYNSILKDDVISPAEIVNMYRTTNSSKEFIETMVLKFQSS